MTREREEVGRVDLALAEAEKVAATADGDWDHFTQRAAVPKQQVEVQQGRQGNAERNLAALNERLARIKSELAGLSESVDETDLDTVSTELADAEQAVVSQKTALDSLKETLQSSRSELEALRQKQDELRREIQALTGQRASLEALQSDAQGSSSGDFVSEWLGNHGIEQRLRSSRLSSLMRDLRRRLMWCW